MKYVLGIFGFIILTIIAIVLLASTTGNRDSSQQEGERVVNLTDYVDSGTVAFTTEGKIVGNESYRSIRIRVSAQERRVQILNGYDNVVQKQAVYPNDATAFQPFLEALIGAGYARERDVENRNMAGVCSLGKRYVYSLVEDDTEVVSLWSTSCSGAQGTFGGDDSLVRRLFQNQIPEYSDFVSGTKL